MSTIELLVSYGGFFVLGGLFILVERIKPARPNHWRPGFSMDVLGLVVITVSNALLAVAVTSALAQFAPVRIEAFGSPAMRVVLFFVAADFARYVAHWFMHMPWLWRTHRFHHSPTQLYWFSGNRATPTHAATFVVPQVLLGWLMSVPPESMLTLIMIGKFMNNLMHANWNIGARWQRILEWFITTPRYHAIHHATDPKFAGKNIASIFTIWDRLFGTYVNPDHVNAAELEFGADVEAVPRHRMVLGV